MRLIDTCLPSIGTVLVNQRSQTSSIDLRGRPLLVLGLTLLRLVLPRLVLLLRLVLLRLALLRLALLPRLALLLRLLLLERASDPRIMY